MVDKYPGNCLGESLELEMDYPAHRELVGSRYVAFHVWAYRECHVI